MTYKSKNAVITIEQRTDLILTAEQEFQNIIAETQATIQWTKEKAFALQYLQNNDYLASVAMRNPLSLKNALANVAMIGISLNPLLRQAYLIPRKNSVVMDLSYLGLIQYGIMHCNLSQVEARIIHEHDNYINCGFNQAPQHNYKPFGDRGQAVGAVVVATTNKGGYLVEEMTKEQIYAIRERSDGWQAYCLDNKKLTPWVTDEMEMWRKTVVRRASKYWKASPEMAAIVNESYDSDFAKEKIIKRDPTSETSDKFQKLAQPVDRVPKTKAVTTKYKNLMVAIQDCMNFSELEEVGNNINNSEFEENELNQLRKAWMDQRKKIKV